MERKIHPSGWQLIEMETFMSCYQKTFSSAVSRYQGQCHHTMTSTSTNGHLYSEMSVTDAAGRHAYNSIWTVSAEMSHLLSVGFSEWRASPLSNQTLRNGSALLVQLMKRNDLVDGVAAVLSVTLIEHLAFYVLATLSLCCTEKTRFHFLTLF